MWFLGTSSIVVLAVAVDHTPYSTIGILGLFIGAALAVGAAVQAGRDNESIAGSRLTVTLAVAAVGLFVFSWAMGDPLFALSGGAWMVLWLGVILMVAGLSWLGTRSTGRWRVAIGGVISLAWIVFVGWLAIGNGFPSIDVLHLHHQAADAIAAGGNPFADLDYFETLPSGRGEDITGYTYPPLTMMLYSVGVWLAGDARWASVAALVAVLLLLIGVGWQRERLAGSVGLSASALVIAQPAWPQIIYLGWTEPVSVPLLYGAALLWTSSPVFSGVLFGLGLVTKQYFLVMAPMLVLIRDPGRMRRSVAAVVAAAVTIVPWLVVNPGAFLDSVVGHHLTRAPRTDAGTIAGLGVFIPGLIVATVALALSVYLARRMKTGSDMLFSVAAVLAVFTALASRGFVNSWWLVGMLTLGGLVFRWKEMALRPDGGSVPAVEHGGEPASDAGGSD